MLYCAVWENPQTFKEQEEETSPVDSVTGCAAWDASFYLPLTCEADDDVTSSRMFSQNSVCLSRVMDLQEHSVKVIDSTNSQTMNHKH